MGTDEPPTDWHAVVVQFVPAAIFTHRQAFLIQHAQQADGTHLFLFVLYAAREESRTLSTKSYSSGLCTYQPESTVWQPHLITAERFSLLPIHSNLEVDPQLWWVRLFSLWMQVNAGTITHIYTYRCKKYKGMDFTTAPPHVIILYSNSSFSYLSPLYPVYFFLKHFSKC